MLKEDPSAVIAMPTLTAALRGETVLSAAGYHVRVIRLPAGSTPKGCAYGLELPQIFVSRAVRVLDGAGLKRGEILS